MYIDYPDIYFLIEKNPWSNYLITGAAWLNFLKINSKAVWWLLGETVCISK